VAVGTTGMSGKEELKLVVAIAMMLHKLPATFGLVSFLIACRWPLPRVRRALLVFAASAPLMALATYWFLVTPDPRSPLPPSGTHHKQSNTPQLAGPTSQPAL
jgi:zinc transporter ZupT